MLAKLSWRKRSTLHVLNIKHVNKRKERLANSFVAQLKQSWFGLLCGSEKFGSKKFGLFRLLVIQTGRVPKTF